MSLRFRQVPGASPGLSLVSPEKQSPRNREIKAGGKHKLKCAASSSGSSKIIHSSSIVALPVPRRTGPTVEVCASAAANTPYIIDRRRPHNTVKC
ncbi:hypothetical protein CEXT_632801 [Caerostris extrusa]|uniref:Uncharacterized protein n=1 Tax=Caerostris extrusa TaxID=172846 RepID=A0AAV4MH67_CAEEX|nr:hypothetical protein CEXT_632801 [Caerostris extrusa]